MRRDRNTNDQANEFQIMRTGVPNLDTVLGGGIPVGSFNLIAGGPGTGKTILSQQMMFHNATPERQALHFTVLGEPVAKLLRYQSRFTFFDPSKINTAIRFIDIGDVIRKEGLERGLDVILSRVERYSPAMVIVDSVRAVREIARHEGEYGLRTFTHDLAQVAVVWNATSFVIGEYEESELRAGPEFTMADGIIWMGAEKVQNSVMRKLQVVKSRGMNPIQGLHTVSIDQNGLYIYPRILPQLAKVKAPPPGRATFGVPGLERMMEGGIPYGQTCLIAGASGTGKSILAQSFAAQGVREGEACVLLTFEEAPDEYVRRAGAFGWPFERYQKEGKIAFVYRRPMELSVDEIIDETHRAVERIGARRLVLDSISGFELARAPADQSNFRESLYRLIALLTSQSVTVLMTTEIPEIFGALKFSTHEISFVADNIILLRYAEIEAELRRLITVIKMRTSGHDKQLHPFIITDRGPTVGAPFHEYVGLLSGVPTLLAITGPQPFAPGLPPRESALVHALFALGRATADELAAEIGCAKPEVEQMLDRLVGMGYVTRETKDKRTTYNVSMVTWAPGIRPPRPTPMPEEGGPGSASE